jgi:uncharacterized protein (DUF427 family)
MWQYRGQKRPDFAIDPKPGQESVWDYPRPPELSPDERWVEVFCGDRIIASSSKTYRVLETASPPCFYIPPTDVNQGVLKSAPGSSVCEWKGVAQYWSLSSDATQGIVGWSYPTPKPAFEQIRAYIGHPDLLCRR